MESEPISFFEQAARNMDAFDKLRATYVPIIWPETGEAISFYEYTEDCQKIVMADEFKRLHETKHDEEFVERQGSRNAFDILLFPIHLVCDPDYTLKTEMGVICHILRLRQYDGADMCGLKIDDFDPRRVTTGKFSARSFIALKQKKRTRDEEEQYDATCLLIQAVRDHRAMDDKGAEKYKLSYGSNPAPTTELTPN